MMIGPIRKSLEMAEELRRFIETWGEGTTVLIQADELCEELESKLRYEERKSAQEGVR